MLTLHFPGGIDLQSLPAVWGPWHCLMVWHAWRRPSASAGRAAQTEGQLWAVSLSDLWRPVPRSVLQTPHARPRAALKGVHGLLAAMPL